MFVLDLSVIDANIVISKLHFMMFPCLFYFLRTSFRKSVLADTGLG